MSARMFEDSRTVSPIVLMVRIESRVEGKLDTRKLGISNSLSEERAKYSQKTSSFSRLVQIVQLTCRQETSSGLMSL